MNNKHNLSFNEFMLIYFMKIKSIKLGIFTATITLATLIFIQPVFAVEVSLITAEKVALNFITYIGEDNYTISNVEPVEDSGEIIGYLVNLAPQGYILIAGDTIRVPIKAYSLTSNFNNLPPAYVKILLNELKVEESLKKSVSGKASGRNQPEEINSSYWEFITQAKIVSRKSLRNYTPDTYLLTTKWDQGYPYNKFNPKDGEKLTVTGCVQTAIAQVMRYHKYPSKGSGVFKHTWGGKTLTAVMNRPFNWDSMPDILDSSTPQYQQDEVAALMRDLGVLNEADFGTDSAGGTSVSFGDSNTNKFKKAFGYSNILHMDNRDNLFFTTIKNEIDNKRPILLAIPGHMTVADGYVSDGSGKKIHVNFGWSGSNDDYYYLDKTITTTQNSFSPQNTIFYNIKPCQGYECDPYITTTSGYSPVIGSYQNGSLIPALSDIVINSNSKTETIRVEAYDLDGDTVTLSALSSCSNLKTNLADNILTITPTASNIFCEIAIKAQSYDGRADKSFKVLVLDEMIYVGSNYNIGGQFADGTEIDLYKSYLGGSTIIGGDMGYSNGQGFFVWIKDSSDNIVVDGTDKKISKTFNDGIYTIYTSLKYTKPSGGYLSYNYDPNHSSYTLAITSSSSSTTVSNLALIKNIALSNDNSNPNITKPDAEIGETAAITANTATLNGKVNPKEDSTRYYFQYGTTTNYGYVTPTADGGSGSTYKNVTANLTGLSSNTTYHFRLVATNSGGINYSSDGTFTTIQQTGSAELSISPTKQNVSKVAGTTTFAVSNIGIGTMAWSASVTSGGNWLLIKSGANGSNPGNITCIYFANTATSTRTATIKVTAAEANGSPKEITVTQASGSTPSVTTGAAKTITTTSAILSGTIKPNGNETAYYFEYGTTKEYGDTTEEKSADSATKSLSVSANLTDLLPATTYNFRLVIVANNGDTIYGSNKTFKTATIKKPTASTGKATLLTSTTATINGTVNPNGTETEFYFEYGTTKDYGEVTETESAGLGTKSFAASANLTDLSPSTTYNFRIVATNSGGTTYSSNKTFKTLDVPKPILTTGSAKSITSTSATLTGTIKPNGSETTYYFEYGTTKDYEDITDSEILASDTKSFTASITLTELIPSTTYYFRVVAENDYGTSYGSQKSFKTTSVKRNK